MITISIIAGSFVLWLLFVAVSPFINEAKDELRGKWYYPLVLLLFVVFIVVDVAYNVTIGTLVFLQWPKWWTLTERLKHNIFHELGWRYRLSLWVCKKMIEPWDRNHCAITRWS